MLKSKYEELSNRIGLKLGLVFSKIPISPNQWTALSVLPALAGGYFLAYQKDLLFGLFFFVVSSLIDAIDGGVARVIGRVTNLGAYLDGVVDRFVEALLLFGLMFYGLAHFLLPGYVWIALLLFFGTMMPSFLRAYADHRKLITDEKELRKMGGVLERAERLVLIFLGMIFGNFQQIYLTYAIVIAVFLSAITVMQRLLFAIRFKAD